jgi:hypothetical protein
MAKEPITEIVKIDLTDPLQLAVQNIQTVTESLEPDELIRAIRRTRRST